MRILTRIIALSFVGSLLLLAGCDSLNLEPKDEFQADQVFEDPGLTRAYLNEMYSHTGMGYGDPMHTPGIVDEALNTHNHPGSQNIMSTLTPGDRGQWDSPGGWSPEDPQYEAYDWGSAYSFIRDLNLFIQNVKGNEVLPANEREALLGEAYFLRGYFYQNLMKLYGGVPIIDGVFELGEGEQQYQVQRNSFTHTVNSVVTDLDSAAILLEGKEPRRQGTATEAAAHALKSRVLLFAASDLYHDSPFGGDNEYVTYSSSDTTRQQLWEGVSAAADEVRSLGYSLGEDLSAEEYHQLFIDGNPNTIWARYFDANAGFNHNQSQWVSPNGYFSWSGDTPTQEHVDAYEMADGSDFQWEGADPTPENPEEESSKDPVDADNPYDDRDPRFYANIHYNSAEWRQRPSGAPQSTDPVGVIQTGEYEMPGGDMVGGLDTDSGPQSWNASRTGYNLRKFIDRSIRPDQQQAYNPWIHIRFAEVLLNEAEAEANLGNLGDARTALNEVRSRVGMPDETAATQPALLAEIRQEREVELAFEGHRYFDVRRWKMGEEAYQDAHGIRIIGELEGNPGSDMTLGELIAQDSYNYLYKVVHRQEREWNNKNYFLPISNEEMNRNTNLVQNPGY